MKKSHFTKTKITGYFLSLRYPCFTEYGISSSCFRLHRNLYVFLNSSCYLSCGIDARVSIQKQHLSIHERHQDTTLLCRITCCNCSNACVVHSSSQMRLRLETSYRRANSERKVASVAFRGKAPHCHCLLGWPRSEVCYH